VKGKKRRKKRERVKKGVKGKEETGEGE